MTALIWVLSVAGYLGIAAVLLKHFAWWFVRKSIATNSIAKKPSDIDDGLDWFALVMMSAFWWVSFPIALVNMGCKAVRLIKWLDREPVPMSQRKAAHEQRIATLEEGRIADRKARKAQLDEDIRLAEANLRAVTASLNQMYSRE